VNAPRDDITEKGNNVTTTWLDKVFNVRKPVIAMLHLAALPGDPGYDSAGGIAANSTNFRPAASTA
jgi:hypothetical protein